MNQIKQSDAEDSASLCFISRNSEYYRRISTVVVSPAAIGAISPMM
jgi:hypothetical protein